MRKCKICGHEALKNHVEQYHKIASEYNRTASYEAKTRGELNKEIKKLADFINVASFENPMNLGPDKERLEGLKNELASLGEGLVVHDEDSTYMGRVRGTGDGADGVFNNLDNAKAMADSMDGYVTTEEDAENPWPEEVAVYISQDYKANVSAKVWEGRGNSREEDELLDMDAFGDGELGEAERPVVEGPVGRVVSINDIELEGGPDDNPWEEYNRKVKGEGGEWDEEEDIDYRKIMGSDDFNEFKGEGGVGSGPPHKVTDKGERNKLLKQRGLDMPSDVYEESKRIASEDFGLDYQKAMDRSLGLLSVSSHYNGGGTCNVCGAIPNDKREHLRNHYGAYFDQTVASEDDPDYEGDLKTVKGLLKKNGSVTFEDFLAQDGDYPQDLGESTSWFDTESHEDEYTCTDCGDKFGDRDEYIDHQNTHKEQS